MTTLIPKFDLKDGGSTPTGAINRTIFEKLSDFISVKDFGAIGDGTTDDTTAINAAIAYAKATSGIKAIQFPTANYLVSGKINIAGSFGNGIVIEGNDSKITSNADNSVFYVNAKLPDAAPQYRINLLLKNFTIIGKGSAYTSSVGIEIVDAAAVKIENCNIQNCYVGIYGYGCLISSFTKIIAQSCYYGLRFEAHAGFAAPNDLHFEYCQIYDNILAIRHVDFPNGAATYIGCEIEGNNQTGTTTDTLRVTEFFNAGTVSLIGCHFEDNPGQYNIYYSSANYNLGVIGCEIIPGDDCGTVLEINNTSGTASLFVEGSRVTNNVGTAQINIGSTCSAVIVGNTSGFIVGTNVTRLGNGVYASNSVWQELIGGLSGTTLIQGNRTSSYEIEPGANATQDLGTNSIRWNRVFSQSTVIKNGITAPSAISGNAIIYVDAADGSLKVVFGNGTVKTIATNP